MSPIGLVIAKLTDAAAVVDKVDIFAGRRAIAPVLLDPKFPGCGIAVNRIYDERNEHNFQTVVMVTCFSTSYEKVEEMGEAVVEALQDGAEPWSHGAADDVQFEKMGPDVTGWDSVRQQYVRSIEFAVNW